MAPQVASPGAETSGNCVRPVHRPGPVLEKLAWTSAEVVAPTARVPMLLAGGVLVLHALPMLPAAQTGTMPAAR